MCRWAAQSRSRPNMFFTFCSSPSATVNSMLYAMYALGAMVSVRTGARTLPSERFLTRSQQNWEQGCEDS